jgi:hypothetical protein
MKSKFIRDSAVSWKWAGGVIYGKVEEIFFEPIRMEIKGKFIKRNGSPEKPAYLVRSIAGNIALKLETELSAVTEADQYFSRMVAHDQDEDL